MSTPSRRIFLKSAGATALGATTQAHAGPTRTLPHVRSPEAPAAPTFFQPQEARFIKAAVACLIPSDETGPGAVDADVPRYIDTQLAGAWGAGQRLYRAGPWREGTASQGYQLPFTPAELFRTALRAAHADVQRTHRTTFDKLATAAQIGYLTALQNGERDLDGVPSNVFFEVLWEMTVEGYFGDPAYGGNKDMAAWRMIGFPGAYGNYFALIEQHGAAFVRAPMSLAQADPVPPHTETHVSAHPTERMGNPR